MEDLATYPMLGTPTSHCQMSISPPLKQGRRCTSWLSVSQIRITRGTSSKPGSDLLQLGYVWFFFQETFSKHQALPTASHRWRLWVSSVQLPWKQVSHWILAHTPVFLSKHATITPQTWQNPVGFPLLTPQATPTGPPLDSSLEAKEATFSPQDSAHHLVKVGRPGHLQISSWNSPLGTLRAIPEDAHCWVCYIFIPRVGNRRVKYLSEVSVIFPEKPHSMKTNDFIKKYPVGYSLVKYQNLWCSFD